MLTATLAIGYYCTDRVVLLPNSILEFLRQAASNSFPEITSVQVVESGELTVHDTV